MHLINILWQSLLHQAYFILFIIWIRDNLVKVFLFLIITALIIIHLLHPIHTPKPEIGVRDWDKFVINVLRFKSSAAAHVTNINGTEGLFSAEYDLIPVMFENYDANIN